MFTVSLVNFIQVSLLTIAMLGLILLWHDKPYRQIRLLLALIIFASIFNLLEELGITRHIHLVTPVFIFGFGPAIYLAVKGLLGEKIGVKAYLHFLPMLLALPFTAATDVVILLGTLWRVTYAAFTLGKLYQFKQRVQSWRSDANELSMTWLIWSISIMTVISMLNLVRLNFQAELGHTLNITGQGISTAVSLVFFVILLRQLIHHKATFFALYADQRAEQSQWQDIGVQQQENQETAEQFEAVFAHLVTQIEANRWYTIPRLTLQQLSNLSGLQPRDISRAINLHGNSNFNDFINQYRLNYVIERMKREPKTTLLTLALDAGFNAKSTFNLAFKRFYHQTPADYRAKLTTSP